MREGNGTTPKWGAFHHPQFQKGHGLKHSLCIGWTSDCQPVPAKSGLHEGLDWQHGRFPLYDSASENISFQGD